MPPPGSQSSTVQLPDTIDGVPNVSGAEELVAQARRGSERRPLTGGHDGGDPFAGIRSACAIALHMHRPLIPAGGEDLPTAPLIRHLQYMSSTRTPGRTTTPRCFAGAFGGWAR